MSNSGLVVCRVKSPNHSGARTHKIDTITIHCVVGQLSAEGIGNCFTSSSVQASSNYGIGYDGRVGLYVDEGNRSWCSSSRENDQRAVTIECASDTTSPYAIKDAVLNKLVILCQDICRRNGIEKLIWSDSKSARVNHTGGVNMTCHRDFANKACPGDYIYAREGWIAAQVNENLATGVLFQGFVGSDVKEMQELLIKAGFSVGDDGADGVFGYDTEKALVSFQTAKGLEADGICGLDTWAALKGKEPEPDPPEPEKLYKVQVGAFEVKANAEKLRDELKAKGYEAFIVEVEVE